MSKRRFDDFFQRVCQATGIDSQQGLATLIGVNRSAVSQAKNRDAVPETWVYKLSRDHGLSADWLERGLGAQRVREAGPVEPEFRQVPKVRARLCAGGGSFETGPGVGEYHAFRWAWLARKGQPDAMVLMDVFGNSMEPEIKDGDMVLLDQSQREIIAGQIYAVGVEDTVMVKRIEKRPKSLVLVSDNSDYHPIVFHGEELETVRIIGKIVWLCREFR